jgi:hypothetical protein
VSDDDPTADDALDEDYEGEDYEEPSLLDAVLAAAEDHLGGPIREDELRELADGLVARIPQAAQNQERFKREHYAAMRAAGFTDLDDDELDAVFEKFDAERDDEEGA